MQTVPVLFRREVVIEDRADTLAVDGEDEGLLARSSIPSAHLDETDVCHSVMKTPLKPMGICGNSALRTAIVITMGEGKPPPVAGGAWAF